MTTHEILMAKSGQAGRDIAFDLMLDRVSKGSGQIAILLTGTMSGALITVFSYLLYSGMGGWFFASATGATLSFAKIAALISGLAWLGYGIFSLQRRNRIERDLIKAQISLLRMQQTAGST